MRLLVAVCLFIAFATLFYLPAGADENGAVDVFVTPKLISITVDEAFVDYHSVEIGVNDARPDPEGFSITNVGTENIDLYIRGDDTQNANLSPGWTLGGAPGDETYVHRFTTNPSPILADFNLLTKSPQLFASGVVPTTGVVDIKLSLATPSQTNNLGPQTTAVTLLATDVGVSP